MTSSRDPDRLIHDFVLEGEEQLPDQVYDAVRGVIEQKRQRVVFGPWRTPTMNKIVTIGLAAAAAVVVALFLGAQFFGAPSGGMGSQPTATTQPTANPEPTPVAVTLASGSFSAPLGEFGEAFTIEAVRTGDDVSGTMEISNPTGGEGAYSVDVQCARTLDDGVLLIGGEVTESTYEEFIEDGAYVVLMFAPGTPVRMLWAVDVLATEDLPTPAESCSAFIDTLLGDPEFIQGIRDYGRPIEGELELGE